MSIVCGDFNCSLSKTGDKSVVKLNGIARNLNFTDLWKEKHEKFIWFLHGLMLLIYQKSRIDYIFLSKNFVYDVKQIIVRTIPGTHSNGCRLSDHRALKCTFYLSKNEKGTGYWKLNTSYLESKREVPRDVRNSKVRRQDKFMRDWSRH